MSRRGQGRRGAVAGFLTAALLLSAGSASGGERAGFREMPAMEIGPGAASAGTKTGIRVHLIPELLLVTAGGDGPWRGVNIHCPFGDGPLRFQLDGRLGLDDESKGVEAGGFLVLSVTF